MPKNQKSKSEPKVRTEKKEKAKSRKESSQAVVLRAPPASRGIPVQRMNQLGSMLSNHSDMIKKHVMALLLPTVVSPQRGPAATNNMPTVLVDPYREYSISLPTTTSLDPDIRQHFVAICKNPFMGVIWSAARVPTYRYDAVFRSMPVLGNPAILASTQRIPLPQSSVGLSNQMTTIQNLEPAYFTYTPYGSEPVAVNGPVLYTQKANGRTWFISNSESTELHLRFFNSGTTVPVTYGGSIQYMVRVYYNSGDDNESVYFEGPINADGNFITLALLGYWRAEVIILSSTIANTVIAVDLGAFIRSSPSPIADQTVLQTRPHAGFGLDGPGLDFANGRVNAASICVSNVSPVVALSGAIAGIQLPTKVSFFSFLAGDNYYDQVTALPRVVPMDLAHGMYGYIKPTALPDSELAPLCAKDQVTGSLVGFESPLFPPGGWAVVAYDRNPSEPLSLIFRISYAMEAAPFTNFYDVETSQTTSTDWMNVCDAVANCPQFTENPIHVKQLLSAAKNAAKGILKEGPEILGLLSKVFPGLRIPSMVLQGANFIREHMK